MEAKRKELTRLNGAYKNTLNNAKVCARTVLQRGLCAKPYACQCINGTRSSCNCQLASKHHTLTANLQTSTTHASRVALLCACQNCTLELIGETYTVSCR